MSLQSKLSLAAAIGLALMLDAAAQTPAAPSSPRATGTNAPAPGMTAGSPNAVATPAPAMNPPATATGSSAAQPAPIKMTSTRVTLSSSDRRFIEKAAQGGLAEVELGQLAKQKASSEDVRKFGARMVDDHSRANDELRQLAVAKGVPLPTAPDASAKRERDKLAGLSGGAFDREYIEHMVSDHKKDVSEFKSASRSKDTDVARFATATLPTLQQHLSQAQSAQKAVKSHAKRSNGTRTASKSG